MSILADKVAIVTGASSGIGRATAQAFAKAGALVVLAARSDERLNEVAKSLNGQALVVPTNVTDGTDRRELIETTIKEFGKLHILVNAAGINAAPLRTISTPRGARTRCASLRSVAETGPSATITWML